MAPECIPYDFLHQKVLWVIRRDLGMTLEGRQIKQLRLKLKP